MRRESNKKKWCMISSSDKGDMIELKPRGGGGGGGGGRDLLPMARCQ